MSEKSNAANQVIGNASLASIDLKLDSLNEPTSAGNTSLTSIDGKVSTTSKQDIGNASLASIDGNLTACDTDDVTISASALPTGAATSAKQDTGNASLASVDTKVATETTLSALNTKVTAVNTGAVVVSSSALPSGASTGAKQDTGNTSLSSIDGKITACNTGAVTISAALPAGTALIGKTGIDQTTPGTTNKVSIGTDGTVAINAAIPAGSNLVGKVGIDQTTPGTTNKVSIGSDGTVAVTSSTLATTAKQDTGNTSLASIDGKITAVNTGAVVVSSSALPSGASTSALQTTGNTSLASLASTVVEDDVSNGGAPRLGVHVMGVDTFDTNRVMLVGTDGAVQIGSTTLASIAKQDTQITYLSSMDNKMSTQSTCIGTNDVDDGGTLGWKMVGQDSGNRSAFLRTDNDGKLQVGIDQTTPGTTNKVAAAQSGTWTVQPGNTPNTTPWLVENRPSGIKTYFASNATYTVPATPTDLVRIIGSATTTVKVLQVTLSCTQTTAGVNTFFLIKRTAANTAGTAVNATPGQMDSSDAAQTAVFNHYTANPSGLGAGTTISTRRVPCPAPASVATPPTEYWDFSASTMKPVVLRGTAQSLVINFGGAALPTGLSVVASVIWTEE